MGALKGSGRKKLPGKEVLNLGIDLIKKVVIEKDGVYVSSHSVNDSAPYQYHRSSFLSDVYREEGQRGLDRTVLSLIYDNAELVPGHPSLQRYLFAIQPGLRQNDVSIKYFDLIEQKYRQLSEEDKNRLYYKPTPEARSYLQYEKDMMEKMCVELAQRCEEYDWKRFMAQYKDSDRGARSFSVVELLAPDPAACERVFVPGMPDCLDDLQGCEKVSEFLDGLPAGSEVSATIDAYLFGAGETEPASNEELDVVAAAFDYLQRKDFIQLSRSVNFTFEMEQEFSYGDEEEDELEL